MADNVAAAGIACFNSIKVRLRPFLPKHYQSKSLFQFHKGAIKTFDIYQPKRFMSVSIP